MNPGSGDDIDTHDHCNSCINLRQCLKSQKKKGESQHLVKGQPGSDLSTSPRKTPTEYCLIISCPEKCEARFHACKLTEHLLLCQQVKVPCVNEYYGCPFVMERRFIRTHLPCCPASVVVCTVEWSRRPCEEGHKISTPFVQDPLDLDVAALNGDLETIRKFRANVPMRLRRLLQTPTHKCAMMPLGVAGPNRIPESISSQAQLEVTGQGQELDGFEEFGSFESANGAGLGHSPPGLQGSVIQQLHRCPPTTLSDIQILSSRPPFPLTYIDLPPGPLANVQAEKQLEQPDLAASSEPKLSLVLDVITKHSGRHLSWSTFMCAQELRRDEFPDHFRNVHSEIRTQLDGWLFRRCPMASYGCPFGAHNLFPRMERETKAHTYKIGYNECLDILCPTQISTEPSTVKGTCEISELPNELLLRLAKYLDPSSLKCLSMTCRRMRDICGDLLATRGIVVLDWEKKSGTESTSDGWVIVGKRWMFSTAFTPVRCWSMSEAPSISNHLSTCQYYAAQKNCPRAPFSYPVTVEDL